MNSHDGISPGIEAAFPAHLALGLHAVAQPLAILRAKLYPEGIARLNATELGQLANDSAGQVERLCTLFNYLQEIVLAETAEPKLTTFSVNNLLEHVVGGVDLWFRDSDIDLQTSLSSVPSFVVADEPKLSQALSSLVLLTHGMSKSGDTVSLSTLRSGEYAEILIINEDADKECLSAEARLALALVETNVRKLHGEFLFSLRPFTLRIRVPKAPITT